MADRQSNLSTNNTPGSSSSISSGSVAALAASPRPSKKVMLLSLCYGLLFVLMLVMAYQGTLPVAWLSNFHNADKIGHLILYCIPSYLGHSLFRYKHLSRPRLGQLRIPAFPALFTLFTIAEELIQGLSPNRTLDAGDMVCSLVGIAVGYWLAQRQQRKVSAS